MRKIFTNFITIGQWTRSCCIMVGLLSPKWQQSVQQHIERFTA